MMKISFVIPAYNEEKFLPYCLDSIKKQKGCFDYEIIVVDNNSTDRTAEIATSLGINLIKETKQGVGAARRIGTAQAKNELIINLDADSRLPENFLLTLEKILNKDQNLVCLGARARFYEVPEWKNYILSLAHYVLYPLALLISGGKLGPIGYCMIFKKSVYKKTSGFNADCKFGEDAKLTNEFSKIGKIKLSLRLVCGVSDRRFRAFDRPLRMYLLNFLYLCVTNKPYKNELPK